MAESENAFSSLRTNSILKEKDFLRYAAKQVRLADTLLIASNTPIMLSAEEQTSPESREYLSALLDRFVDTTKETYYYMNSSAVNQIMLKEDAEGQLNPTLENWNKQWNSNPNLHVYVSSPTEFPQESLWVAKRGGVYFVLTKLSLKGNHEHGSNWLLMHGITDGILNTFKRLNNKSTPFRVYIKKRGQELGETRMFDES